MRKRLLFSLSFGLRITIHFLAWLWLRNKRIAVLKDGQVISQTGYQKIVRRDAAFDLHLTSATGEGYFPGQDKDTKLDIRFDRFIVDLRTVRYNKELKQIAAH